ncbi:MAG TPA: GNAT family N-acetyltransferase [Solirubrobacterales bacterium]|jgi:GNAT superfamily N-acetyltransferase|nr:GNAT family N-acetyltransferase [Solirubrobacterales bacterium]
MAGGTEVTARELPGFVIRPTDPEHSDALRCLRLFSAALDRRLGPDFSLAANGSGDRQQLMPPSGRLLVAYLRGEPVGSGAIRHRPGRPSEIDRLWVARVARRAGIGRLLLAELELRALVAGASAVRLEIPRQLREAIAMCRSAGYIEVPQFNGHAPTGRCFEKAL